MINQNKFQMVITNFLKSQIFVLPVISFLLFLAVCYILLGVFWRPFYIIWAALPAYIIYQNLFYYILLVSFLVICAIVVVLSRVFIKNKQTRIYSCMFILSTVFAIFFSLLVIHLQQFYI